MAKMCMINRDKKRAQLAENGKTIREELKAKIKDVNVDFDEKMQAVTQLSQRPRDESPCRFRRRCLCCGRSRSVKRKFKMCRLCLRKMAMLGHVPGLVKSSW
jgi:small subunit ribosomal protein S14